MNTSALPEWASQMIALYESNAASQFILHGNIGDRLMLPPTNGNPASMGSLAEFILKCLLERFDVVLSYDIANGVRVEHGGEVFTKWPGFKEKQELPRNPLAAMDLLTRYFRYCANLAKIAPDRAISVGCIIKDAHMVAPAAAGGFNYEVNSFSLLMREWANDPALTGHNLVTFLLTENINDLHPILANNARSPRVKIPLPSSSDIATAIALDGAKIQTAIRDFSENPTQLAERLTGATLNSVDALLKLKEYRKEAISMSDLVALKKQIVEEECQGLIEFIQPTRTLDGIYGQDRLKAWLRQDIALWRKGDTQAIPMGYLICGPVGTGKTYMVECLAGEAGVPVVKIRNFRDKWIGSTEGNLEKIFRLLQALGRCYVFIDEADQALGKRDTGANDSGLSGRIYSMIAAEMSKSENRGRIVWILASSRPDLIEVDLKRPGRVDFKIPIFPTSTPEESWGLISALAKRQGVELNDEDFSAVRSKLPVLLTPGAAEALAVKMYRAVRARGEGEAIQPLNALLGCLEGYRNPVPRETMRFQIELAVAEASDIEFVPAQFRDLSAAPEQA